MTKIDERASVPSIGPRELDALRIALDRPGVVAAWLFGSQADGRSGPLSDVDIAAWAERGLSPAERLALRLELAGAAARTLGTDEVDVTVLDDAPPLLRHRAMGTRILLVERDRDERVRRETRALLEYLDTVPLRRLADDVVRRRLAEDRFGRS